MKQATQDILRTACPAMYADIFTVIDDTMFGTKKYWKQQFSKCFEDIQEEYSYQDTLQYKHSTHESKQLCLQTLIMKFNRTDFGYLNHRLYTGIISTSGRNAYE